MSLSITEVKELSEMEKHTAVLILPSLVVRDKLVCVGRFPKKDEIVACCGPSLKGKGRRHEKRF